MDPTKIVGETNEINKNVNNGKPIYTPDGEASIHNADVALSIEEDNIELWYIHQVRQEEKLDLVDKGGSSANLLGRD